MSKLSHIIIAKIKAAKISPRPHWQYLILNILLWLGVILSVILGGLAVGLTIFEITNLNFEFLPHLGPKALVMIPYLWLIAGALTIVSAFSIYKKTPTGYRHPAVIIVGLITIGAIILGAALFLTGKSNQLDAGLYRHLPPYAHFMKGHHQMWAAPDRGILVGQITTINTPEEFWLIDVKGKTWLILVQNKRPPLIILEPNMMVGLRGQPLDEQTFSARLIRPWPRPPFLLPDDN